MYGRILKVDLSTAEIKKDLIPPDLIRDYIGGAGLAARLLWDELKPELSPLDPSNPLLFITGPLTGTAGPTTGRFTICARSPQTGWWGESNIGGFMGPELRAAGYDALWITGRAATPLYLWIHADQVELRPADHLWGQDPYWTQSRIREETGQARCRVAAIGIAGENGVPCAGILADHGRLAARTGMGMLMGSKNLKAVAVRGTGRIETARPERYNPLRVEANKRLREQNMTAVMHETGTSGAADYLQLMGDMPIKYWTQATWEGAGQISGAEMASTILTGTSACQGCVIACGREVMVKSGPYATLDPDSGESVSVKGPEYETICSFGSQLLIDDLAAITALGNRCDRLGMDTISAGAAIALAYLLFERGLISEQDTGGLALHWGDPQPVFILLEQMARKTGFGALLAAGSRALAAHYGVEELAVQVNGLDVAMHDPRAFTGQALSYVLSPRGACHNQSDFFTIELGGTMEDIGLPMTDRLSSADKAAYVARHQHWRTLCNDLLLCFFSVIAAQEVVDLVAAATGQERSLEELLLAGERAWNLKRLYNLRLGWTPANEKLPRLLLEPLQDGGQMGAIPDMEQLLADYYAAAGWDRASGWPTSDTLERLGLKLLI
jgi:aldehyde:ferredoxin oxidoreductase